MTNIGAIKVTESTKKGKKAGHKQYLVFVADGMGSVPEFIPSKEGGLVRVPGGGTKQDNSQKLLRIGNYLIMGSGGRSEIERTYQALRNRQFSSVTELAEQILYVTHKFGLTKDDGLEFIVGGKEASELAIGKINATGNFLATKGFADYSKRGYYFAETFAESGSGQKHVADYLNTQDLTGKPILFQDLAEGLCLAHEFGKQAAADSFVNDKLQYGIISETGASIILHPDIKPLDKPFWYSYIEDMCQVPFPYPIVKLTSQQYKELMEKGNSLVAVLFNFYTALDINLKKYSNAKLNYTTIAEYYLRDAISLSGLKAAKQKVKETHNIVQEGVNAFLQKGLEPMTKYIKEFNDTMRASEQKALTYLAQNQVSNI